MKSKLLLILAVFISGLVKATTYKIDTTVSSNIDYLNAQTFAAGDSILFHGGQNFYGELKLKQSGLYLGSYDGIATLYGYRVMNFLNVDHLTIENLQIKCFNRYVNWDGIKMNFDSGITFRSINLKNLVVEGFAGSGIEIATLNSIDSLNIIDCEFKNNGINGILLVSYLELPMSNLSIQNCKCYGNTGANSHRFYPNGVGISIRGLNHVNIIDCDTHDNGNNILPRQVHSGIMLYNTDSCSIINCRSYNNKGQGPYSGAGFYTGGYAGGANKIEHCKTFSNQAAGYVFDVGENALAKTTMLNDTSIDDATQKSAAIALIYWDIASYANNVFFDSTYIRKSAGFAFSGFDSLMTNVSFKNTTVCLTDSAKMYVDSSTVKYVEFVNTIFDCQVLAIKQPKPNPKPIKPELSIYPNPFLNTLMVALPKQIHPVRIRIVNVNGSILIDAPIRIGTNRINVSKLLAGTYFVTISNDYRIIKSQKLVKL
jgi:hypothetical protein